MQDLLGGQVQSAFIDTGNARANLASGKFKVLAATGSSRQKNLPNVPTFLELGYKNFERSLWYGIFVPAGTPKPIVDKLSALFVRAMRYPDVLAQVENFGWEAAPRGALEFGAMVRADGPVWAQLIKAAKIKLD